MMVSWKNDFKFPTGTWFHIRTLMLVAGNDVELVVQAQDDREEDNFRFPLVLNNLATTLLGSIGPSFGSPFGHIPICGSRLRLYPNHLGA
jgi:hypothetical protein